MIKAAAYCRISTNQEDQANSFISQQHFFRDYIDRNPSMELYEIYADEGITGTSTKNRKQFNRMIQDARMGHFQLILTKEVSRFSRNILDTIAYTRELKSLGVAVHFVTDGIHTLDPDAELRLSIMASIAQEESRRTSNRVIWGQSRQMEKGVVFGHSLLGYTVQNGKMYIEPEGAEIVRMIFEKYALEQQSASQIAKYLTNRSCLMQTWHPGTIVRILKNEKYVGDLIQKKTYTPDYLTHEKKKNNGVIPMIVLKNHHTPIISREVWELAQDRIASNHRRKDSHSCSGFYPFSGKILCGQCGASFISRTKYLKDGSGVRRWSCSTAARKGVSVCSIGKLIRDDDAIQMFQTAILQLSLDKGLFVQSILKTITEAINRADQEALQIQNNLLTAAAQIQIKQRRMMDSYFSGEINREELQSMKDHYAQQLEQLRAKEIIKACSSSSESIQSIQKGIDSILAGREFCEQLCRVLLDRITVYPDRRIALTLRDIPRIFWFNG